MSLTGRQYKYNVISLDLGVARSNTAQGLTKKINVLSVITIDSGTLSVRLNSATNTLITLATSLTLNNIQMSELYWTNLAQPGKTAKIFIAWVD